ncbi:MAG TPA: RNA polymerase sigma factor [Candidatus Acidoferrum sp.]|nr:RNA polymerase sigma factor [Candidatus Acidoferrum sp.]
MHEDETTAAPATAFPGRVLPLRRAESSADRERLTWAYQTHVTAIYQFIYSRVGNRADAEDLTAQVFMKAINGMRTDVSVPELRSWIYKVAQTTLADHWREYYAEDTAELEDEVSRPPAPRENPEAVQRVDALLATLPESYRRVLELRFLKGYSVRETAQELNLSETNVKVLQFRALNRAGRERGRPS